MAFLAVAVHLIDFMLWVHFATAMSRAGIAGKVLIVAEKTAISRNPASHRFEAGCFWSVVHDDWLLCRHDFVLAAIAADFEGGGVIEGGEQRVSASVLREAEARIFYDSAKVSYQDLERI